jgi:hypothetical protein
LERSRISKVGMEGLLASIKKVGGYERIWTIDQIYIYLV